MSTTVFPFKFQAPRSAGYMERLEYLGDFGRSFGGKSSAILRAANPMFRASGAIRLPDGSTDGSGTANTPSTFWAFVDDMDGQVDTFLYPAIHTVNRFVSGGALGTGDASTVAFAFSNGTNLHKHIINGDHNDAVTLVVYVAGAVQALTTDYTVSGNDSDLTVTFEAGSTPGAAAAITVDYEFYMPVRFGTLAMPATTLRRRTSDDLDTQEVVHIPVTLAEDSPGARFV
jgi:hypothetical protein